MFHKVLYLTRHCVETEIKRLYNRAVGAYFRQSDESMRKALENEIDLLHQALETFDFGDLRSRHPALSGHSDARVELFADEKGRLLIAIDGETVHAD